MKTEGGNIEICLARIPSCECPQYAAVRSDLLATRTSTGDGAKEAADEEMRN